jgi:enoyl-CoA hydratase/carnithine racemase
VQSILAKLLAPPMPTVAAVTGHAFGGGAMLGMAHDWRVMRTDRGYCPKPAW